MSDDKEMAAPANDTEAEPEVEVAPATPEERVVALEGELAEAQDRLLRALFEMLETRETMLRLLDASKRGDGVQIFIGAQSHLFGLAGCSVIIAPYQNSREEIVGAIGVIGPTRINYARIIPMVDYTAKVIGRLIG